MAISNPRALDLCKSVLTLTMPKGAVSADPAGRMTDAEALTILTAEVVAAESALDADQRPFLRAFAAYAYLHGPLEGTLLDLQTRINVLVP